MSEAESVSTQQSGGIARALIDVMKDIKAVGKDSENSAQKFKFRGIDAILSEVAPILRKHEVVIIPNASEPTYREYSRASGGTLIYCTIKVAYKFIASDGSFIEATMYGEAMDSGDKSTSKAFSVAYRNLLIQTFAIPTGDPDPDHDSYMDVLPTNIVELIKGASSLDELNGVSKVIQDDKSLSKGVLEGLRNLWSKRKHELEQVVTPATETQTTSPTNTIRGEINYDAFIIQMHGMLTAPEKADLYSFAAESGVPGLAENGIANLTQDQKEIVANIGKTILNSRERIAKSAQGELISQ